MTTLLLLLVAILSGCAAAASYLDTPIEDFAKMTKKDFHNYLSAMHIEMKAEEKPLIPKEMTALLKSLTIDDYDGIVAYAKKVEEFGNKGEPVDTYEAWGAVEDVNRNLYERGLKSYDAYIGKVENLSMKPKELVFDTIEKPRKPSGEEHGVQENRILAEFLQGASRLSADEQAELELVYPNLTMVIKVLKNE
ncbi:hypothetical protein QR680_013802 [Steinernema hermaphroditum]|uniref:Uncharacterized protein n=1 Tax=Steinernema hermaphroditum TaxID=289476 RepID=A0AA39I9C0_9BILA|nr:hypothetical protein QR680_013802 [Steinernema hermaphroditum]